MLMYHRLSLIFRSHSLSRIRGAGDFAPKLSFSNVLPCLEIIDRVDHISVSAHVLKHSFPPAVNRYHGPKQKCIVLARLTFVHYKDYNIKSTLSLSTYSSVSEGSSSSITRGSCFRTPVRQLFFIFLFFHATKSPNYCSLQAMKCQNYHHIGKKT